MPTPTPAKRNTESIDAAKSLGPVLGGAVLMTLLGAAVALAFALPGRNPRAREIPVASPSSPVRTAPVAGEEIDVSDSLRSLVPAASGASGSEVSELVLAAALVERDPGAALIWLERIATPDTRDAQHKKLLEVRALVLLQRIGAARTQAGVYYRDWPDGPDVPELIRLTGRRPRP